ACFVARMGSKDHKATEQDEPGEDGQIARGRLDEGPQLHGVYSDNTSCASRSTRGTMTLTRFLMLRLARPPYGVPVIAKYPVVVACGGMMPEASTMDA